MIETNTANVPAAPVTLDDTQERRVLALKQARPLVMAGGTLLGGELTGVAELVSVAEYILEGVAKPEPIPTPVFNMHVHTGKQDRASFTAKRRAARDARKHAGSVV